MCRRARFSTCSGRTEPQASWLCTNVWNEFFFQAQAAPRVLNSAGAGDILSCYTALWDWREAHVQLGEEFSEEIAERIQRKCLARVYAEASELCQQTEVGLRMLSDLFAEEVFLCEQWGNARPEEGSEHYIAYALEAKTGKHYIHGQLIGLCILLVAHFQGQDTGVIGRCLQDLGLDCSFAANQTSRDELREILLTMGDYVRSESQLLPGVFHFRGSPAATMADEMLDVAEAFFPPPATQ
eukprot:m.267396 g.267396  ORF g.267396 m.267396 type:complete len:240 (+) comp19732_c0_seq17:894-1613(+)